MAKYIRTGYGAMVQTSTSHNYLVYEVSGKKRDLRAWYNSRKEAYKEASFLRGKGYEIEVVENLSY